MFRHHTLGFQGRASRRTHFDWYLLTFLAGSINAGGYLAAHRFVSHVTGFATLSGIEAAHFNFDQAIGLLSVPVYFLLGVMLSAYLLDRRVHQGHRPLYSIVMGVQCVCLLMVAIGGYLHLFGHFGSEPKIGQDYFLLALLCMASGLQNAAITTASGSTVRTTHLTGLTTDLGIGLVRALTDTGQYSREMRAAWIRLGSIASFFLGSGIGAYFYLRVQYVGFFLPAGLAAFAMFEAERPRRRLQRILRIRAQRR